MTARAAFHSSFATSFTRRRALPLSPPGAGANSRPLPFRARARLVLEIVVAYLIVRLRTPRTQLPALVGALRGRGDFCVHPSEAELALQRDLAVRLGYIVQALLRRAPADGPCLVRSLVLTKLLARRQIPARLVIGVRSKPSFSAHAWVEHHGEPVLPTDGEYRRLVEL